MQVKEKERNKVIEGNTGPWEIVIGLEVHAQIISESKLFSGSSTAFGADPNTQVSLIDAAFPGMLPVLNRACIRQAIRTGLGLNAEINLNSFFERKNYFYADLPQGYQISQYQEPLVKGGYLIIDLGENETKKIEIERLHVEQDAGKSMHDQHPKKSYIDLNRSGIALMEIVSQPDLRSAEEAGAYLRKLRSILRYLHTCDGNMEQGSMRADVNVSVRRPGEPLGTRCEVKNLNSIRFVQQAVEYEAQRQVEIIENGGKIDQETRLFDTNTGETRTMRSKEDAHDYRYFPDPDLLPVALQQKEVEKIREELPELPDEKKTRYIKEYELSAYDASVLVSDQKRAFFFEDVVKGNDPKMTANWVTGPFFGALNKNNMDIDHSPVSAVQLSALLQHIQKGDVSNRMAKDVFEIMWNEQKTAEQIIEEKGLKQVSDSSEIEKIISEVLVENPKMVEEYKSGKEKLFGFFVGQTMKKSKGKANPQIVNEILKKKIS